MWTASIGRWESVCVCSCGRVRQSVSVSFLCTCILLMPLPRAGALRGPDFTLVKNLLTQPLTKELICWTGVLWVWNLCQHRSWGFGKGVEVELLHNPSKVYCQTFMYGYIHTKPDAYPWHIEQMFRETCSNNQLDLRSWYSLSDFITF